MTLSSIKLAMRCYEQGLLSKEAAEAVLHVRERILRDAMAEKTAGLFNDMKSFLVKTPPPVVEAPASFASNLKKGLGFGGGKPSSWGEATGNIGKMLLLGGALAAGGAAASGIMRHSKDKKIKGEIEESYKKMYDETPALNMMDKTKVDRHFGVLARYAPSLAADPTIAGTWVANTVRMGQVDADLVSKLSTTQSLIDRHHEGKSLFPPGHFAAGMTMANAALGRGGNSEKPSGG